VETKPYDLAIVGGGPAGLTAALYAGRSKVKAVLLEAKAAGGQLLNTEVLEDYPGFKRVDGHELARHMIDQATHFGADVVEYNPVERIRVEADGTKRIETESGEVYTAPAVIITAGGNPRKLDVPGEAEYAGRGVSYCAVCDGAFFQGEHLAVIGGGDAAVEEALFLTRYASKVTLIHRRDAFRAAPILVHEALAHEKVETIMDTVVDAIEGTELTPEGGGKTTRLRLRNVKSPETTTLEVGGVFIFVGFLPNTGLVDVHIDHDPAGYYLTDPYSMMTSVPGIFAAGDVRAQLTRQVTTAVGDATTATLAAVKWTEERAKGNPDPFRTMMAASREAGWVG
jgi:thioredoxin reductase (NADPH)